MKIEMVANFRTALRFWSIRAGVLVSLVIGYVINNPDAAAQVLNVLPPEARTWLSGPISLFLFGVIYFLRMVKQIDKDKSDAPKSGTAPEGGAKP